MGYYIEVPENLDKAFQLKRDHGAVVTGRPRLLSEVPKGKTLICVVENGPFDAAGIVFDQMELEDFSETHTGRPRTWMLMDTTKVLELCPRAEKVLLTNQEEVRE